MIGKNSNYVTVLTDNGNEVRIQINKNNSICDTSLTGEVRSKFLNKFQGRQLSLVEESMCNFINTYAE